MPKWRNPRIPMKDSYLTVAMSAADRGLLDEASLADGKPTSTWLRGVGVAAAQMVLATISQAGGMK